MQGIGVAATVLSACGVVVAIVMARKEARVRPGFDGLRLLLTAGGIAVMAAVTAVSTPAAFVALAVVGGTSIGWAQGRATTVRIVDGRAMARRSAMGIGLFGAGMLVMQISGLMSRAGVFRIGQAISYFSAALAAGVLFGREPRLRQANAATTGAALVSSMVVLLMGTLGLLVMGAPRRAAADHCGAGSVHYLGTCIGNCDPSQPGCDTAEEEEDKSQPPPPQRQQSPDDRSSDSTVSDSGGGVTYECPEGQVMRYENGGYWCYEYVDPEPPPAQERRTDTQSGDEQKGPQHPADETSTADMTTDGDVAPDYNSTPGVDYGSGDDGGIEPDEALAATITGLIVMAGLGVISVAEAGAAIGQLLGRDDLGSRLLGRSRPGGSLPDGEPQPDAPPPNEEELLPPDPHRRRSTVERFEEAMRQAGDARVKAMTKDPEAFKRMGGRWYEPLDRIRDRVDARGGWVTEEDIAAAKRVRDQGREYYEGIEEAERRTAEVTDLAASGIEGAYILTKAGASVMATGGGAGAVGIVQGSTEFFESIGKGKGVLVSGARGIVSGGFGAATAPTGGSAPQGFVQGAKDLTKEVGSGAAEEVLNTTAERVIETGQLPTAAEAIDAAEEGGMQGAQSFVGEKVMGKVLGGGEVAQPRGDTPRVGSDSAFDVRSSNRSTAGPPSAGSSSEFEAAGRSGGGDAPSQPASTRGGSSPAQPPPARPELTDAGEGTIGHEGDAEAGSEFTSRGAEPGGSTRAGEDGSALADEGGARPDMRATRVAEEDGPVGGRTPPSESTARPLPSESRTASPPKPAPAEVGEGAIGHEGDGEAGSELTSRGAEPAGSTRVGESGSAPSNETGARSDVRSGARGRGSTPTNPFEQARAADPNPQPRGTRPAEADASVGGTDPKDYGRTVRTRFGDLTMEPGARRPQDPPDPGGGRKAPRRDG